MSETEGIEERATSKPVAGCRDIGAGDRFSCAFFRVISLAFLVQFLLAPLSLRATSPPAPKRVLLVHSFGSASPPFTVHSTAFETALVEKMGERVDLDEVSVDMARYADPEMQDALVDYLEKRFAKWQPDLVATIGSPAGIFIAKYRDRLFPHTAILYASIDRRLLPEHALDKNAAFVGMVIDLPGLLEDMMRVAPETKNIAVVAGATPLEKFWKEAFRKAAEPLAPRVNFTYFDDLSFDQMLERAATLPPHSYIFFELLLRDAAGVTHNADEALQRLHAVANCPINGIFDHQMGLGIVGGRLFPSEQAGREAAAMAVAILHGQPASSLPPRLIERLPPRYDWRELQKWKIDQARLPSGSTILFREPRRWQRYRGWIIASAVLSLGEAVLISVLVTNLLRRRRAESSLNESEARFRTMADATPVLIWMAGPDKLCTFFNKAWLEFTGRTMKQELGNGWSEGVHPDDFKDCLNTYLVAFDARKLFTMTYRLRRHDGNYRFVSDAGAPRYGQRGDFRGYVGACVDVTDVLEKEQKLHDVEERIALATEAAHLGVWELDTVTKKVWLSDRAREIFHLDPQKEITYQEFQERVHAEDRARRDELVRQAIATKGRYQQEYRVVLPHGDVRWIIGRGHCIASGNGNCRLLGVSIDITERKRTEQIFRLAAEESHLGVWDWDETTGELLCDEGMRAIFDIPSEAKMTLGLFYSRIHPHDREIVERGWRDALESGVTYQLDYRVQRLNGAVRWLHSRGSGSYDDKGKPLRMTGIAFDITDRKLAEEEAQHRREQVDLLSRASLLGEMTATLAHELNQPLSAIVNNAAAGIQYIEKNRLDPKELKEIFADVVADGRRAYDIMHEVRNAIKKGDALRGRINLNDVVQTVTHMIRPHAVIHFCEIETSLAENLPAIEADPTQIQQVLINLVRNAFDAMGEIPPDRRRVEITTGFNGDGMARVTVRDHGHGISAQTRERLFEQFFTTKEEGLGMGLSIVRSIVEAHGGTISVENVRGGGACFYFDLPVSNGVQA